MLFRSVSQSRYAGVLVGSFTGIDLTSVQKAVEDSFNDSTQVHKSTDELGDSIVNDSVCFTTDSLSHEK